MKLRALALKNVIFKNLDNKPSTVTNDILVRDVYRKSRFLGLNIYTNFSIVKSPVSGNPENIHSYASCI